MFVVNCARLQHLEHSGDYLRKGLSSLADYVCLEGMVLDLLAMGLLTGPVELWTFKETDTPLSPAKIS